MPPHRLGSRVLRVCTLKCQGLDRGAVTGTHCQQRRPARPLGDWAAPEGQGRAVPAHTALAEGWQDLARQRSGGREQRPACPVSTQGTRQTQPSGQLPNPQETKQNNRTTTTKTRASRRFRALSPPGEKDRRNLGVESGGREERGSLGLGVRAWERASERPALPASALGALRKEGVAAAGIGGSRRNLLKVTPLTGPDFKFEANGC